MRPLRKTRPQRVEQDCPSCDGVGRYLEPDWDDEGQRVTVDVACDGCLGSGRLIDCQECDEPTPASVIEDGGGICGGCRAHREMCA